MRIFRDPEDKDKDESGEDDDLLVAGEHRTLLYYLSSGVSQRASAIEYSKAGTVGPPGDGNKWDGPEHGVCRGAVVP